MNWPKHYKTQWRRALQLPPRIVLQKIAAKVNTFCKRQYLLIKREAGLSAWSGSHHINLALKKESRELLKNSLGLQFPFWDLNNMPQLRALLLGEHPAHVKAIIQKAQDILEGRYLILHEHPVNLKEKSKELALTFGYAPTYLPWHYDWLAPYRWDPRQPYMDCPYAHFDGIDVKLPWELSRFHHLTTLAQAYLLTEKQDYADEIVTQILDWHENNPPGYGVNWACAMDVSIRLANICFALSLLGGATAQNKPSLEKLYPVMPALVFDHIWHIWRNLEWPTNHLIADYAGIALAGALYPHFQASEHWGQKAWQGLSQELKRQVYADGMHFEASTSYHRLVLEMFLYSWMARRELTWNPQLKLDSTQNLGILPSQKSSTVPPARSHSAQRLRRPRCRSLWLRRFVSSKYPSFESRSNAPTGDSRLTARIHLLQMLTAAEIMQKPTGAVAQFGDNDSGRFLNLAPETAQLTYASILAVGALTFEKESIAGAGERPPPETLWLLGPQAKDHWQKLRKKNSEHSPAKPQAYLLQNAGVAVFKDPQRRHYLAITNGPNGQNNNGGHAHNDKLSFEFAPYGEDLLVDPGTGLYLRRLWLRQEMRSTRAHNTLMIADEEQNRMLAPFALAHDVKEPAILKCFYDAAKDCFEFLGEHDGYKRLKPPVIHRRRILLEFQPTLKLTIEDELRVEKNVPTQTALLWSWTVAPDIAVKAGAAAFVELITPNKRCYRLEGTLPLEVQDGCYSPNFGQIKPTRRIVARLAAAIPCRYQFTVAEVLI